MNVLDIPCELLKEIVLHMEDGILEMVCKKLYCLVSETVISNEWKHLGADIGRYMNIRKLYLDGWFILTMV